MRFGLLFVIGATAILFRPWIMAGNALQRLQMKRAFAMIPHPEGTHLVRPWSDIGVLTGASNLCHIFVGEVRSTTLPPEDLLRFYADHEEIEIYHSQNLPRMDYIPLAVKYDLNVTGDDLYVVFLFENGIVGDIRCM